ncbi:RNA polymerase sigma factor [Kitasatospora terrestris]|uniref:RNA polymerase sigma-70 region 2 domain-containing protein n=1 Tax=Kitasatospora terrestris TaxID=258051 RepID=A0ABP9E393_9ACTN
MNATDFDQLYRDHKAAVTRHIERRLFTPDRHLAEDLTADTFLTVWRKLEAGLVVEHPRAFLYLSADRTIAEHFRRRSSGEQAMDFGATNTTEAASGAADTPHLAGLFAELEEAREVLTNAAATYRAAYRRHNMALANLSGSKSVAARARSRARVESTEQCRQVALAAFQRAGEVLREAREAWNTGAGELSGLGLQVLAGAR